MSNPLFKIFSVYDCLTKFTAETEKRVFTDFTTLYFCNKLIFVWFAYSKYTNDEAYDIIRRDDNGVVSSTYIEGLIYSHGKITDDSFLGFEMYCKEFWDSIITEIDDVKDFIHNSDASLYRNENGGNLLFRPKSLVYFVCAVSQIKHRNNEISFNLIAQKMNSINLQLDSQEWGDVLWDKQNRKLITENNNLVGLLLLHYFDNNFFELDEKNELLSLYVKTMQITLAEAASRLHISEV
jgi:DNA sulfur modification protein DndB